MNKVDEVIEQIKATWALTHPDELEFEVEKQFVVRAKHPDRGVIDARRVVAETRQRRPDGGPW